MAKRQVDKEQYFTSPSLAQKCVRFADELVDLSSFSLVVEPSAGDGSFLRLLPSHNRIGVDIDPQPGVEGVVEADFLEWNPESHERFSKLANNKPDRILTIGNPPFGQRGAMAFSFIKHAASFSETIAFILPRSFNKYTFQERIPANFHLVGSFDCDDFYTPDGNPVKVNTVFQVWQRKDERREGFSLLSTHPDFQMKHAHLSRVSPDQLAALRRTHPFTVPQVGASFKTKDSNSVTKGSHWFIKPLAEGVRERLDQADYSFLENMNVAHKSLSKKDIIRAYAQVADQEK